MPHTNYGITVLLYSFMPKGAVQFVLDMKRYHID